MVGVIFSRLSWDELALPQYLVCVTSTPGGYNNEGNFGAGGGYNNGGYGGFGASGGYDGFGANGGYNNGGYDGFGANGGYNNGGYDGFGANGGYNNGHKGRERINGTTPLGIVATVLRLLSFLVRRMRGIVNSI